MCTGRRGGAQPSLPPFLAPGSRADPQQEGRCFSPQTGSSLTVSPASGRVPVPRRSRLCCLHGHLPVPSTRPSALDNCTAFLPFLRNSFSKAQGTLKEKNANGNCPGAERSAAVSHGIVATWGQTIFYLGSISSLAFITPLLNTAHATQRQLEEKLGAEPSWTGRGIGHSAIDPDRQIAHLPRPPVCEAWPGLGSGKQVDCRNSGSEQGTGSRVQVWASSQE